MQLLNFIVVGFNLWIKFGISHVIEFTYRDIEKINASCFSLDNCKYHRTKDDLERYNCNCKDFCTDLDTCCIDSPHREKQHTVNSRLKCNLIHGYGHVFMVDDCISHWKSDASIIEQCNSDGKNSNDPFLSLPVTNPITGITYKNFYCSVCNKEEDKELIFWNLALKSRSDEFMTSFTPELFYNSSIGAWTVRNTSISTVVDFIFHVPKEVENVVHGCVPDVISDCASDWIDPSVIKKCMSYMAISRFYKGNDLVVYRNPHCAVCNFEDPNEIMCADGEELLRKTGIGSRTFFVGLFTFHDKVRQCEKNMVYDSFGKRCRLIYKG